MNDELTKQFNEYKENSPAHTSVNWWDLSKGTKIGFKNLPKTVRLRGNTTTIGRLLSILDKEEHISKDISYLISDIFGQNKLKINFPIELNNEAYVKLFALMASEGSTNSEFTLHVPE
jgi:hypothetical protein